MQQFAKKEASHRLLHVRLLPLTLPLHETGLRAFAGVGSKGVRGIRLLGRLPNNLLCLKIHLLFLLNNYNLLF